MLNLRGYAQKRTDSRMNYSLQSDDGRHSVVFTMNEQQVISHMEISPPISSEESVRFVGPLPDCQQVTDVPEHVQQEAVHRGSKVCSYKPHCELCFCDSDGSMTCYPRC